MTPAAADTLLDAVLDLRAAVRAEVARGGWAAPGAERGHPPPPLDLAALPGCARCARSGGRLAVVTGGTPRPCALVVVSDPPGPVEEQAGEPLVGEANAMLDRMLANVLGLARREVLVTPAVKCAGAAPDVAEGEACRGWLDAQLAICRPAALLVMGRQATVALFGAGVDLDRHRGLWKEYRGIPSLPTFDPSALLERPGLKRAVFEDLKALAARLRG